MNDLSETLKKVIVHLNEAFGEECTEAEKIKEKMRQRAKDNGFLGYSRIDDVETDCSCAFKNLCHDDCIVKTEEDAEFCFPIIRGVCSKCLRKSIFIKTKENMEHALCLECMRGEKSNERAD